jgi:EthD domain
MQKLFYLLRDSASADGDSLRTAIVEKAVPAIRASGASGITVFAADREVATGRPVRQIDPPIRAMISFWLEDAADRAPAEAALRSLVKTIAGYLVVESRPLVHEMPLGKRTPGMKQISCVTKRADLSQEEFIRIWHGDHRKVAIETQSTFGYVRNEIFRPVTEGAPTQWTAIVEESFPMGALNDSHVFYDAKSEAEYQANLKRMMDSCGRFLDNGPIEVTFVSEYYLG